MPERDEYVRQLIAERDAAEAKVTRVEVLRKRYRFLGGDWSGFADDLDATLAGQHIPQRGRSMQPITDPYARSADA